MATEQPGKAFRSILPERSPGAAGSGAAVAAPREFFKASDFSEFTRFEDRLPLRRVTLATGAGVCLHREPGGFVVQIHAHDGDGGYLLGMTQAEAGRLADRLAMFARLTPGLPVDGSDK